MTAADPRVGEIEARLNAATPGPWELIGGNEYLTGVDVCIGSAEEGGIRLRDAEFIAHSPSDVAYLLAELRKRDEVIAVVDKVRAIHEPVEALMYSGIRQYLVKVCAGCGTDDGNWQRWPCPTVAALGADS